ncbi:hypothetical protein BOTBODRAFT_37478 [Botryobasidium botryosum FD-172 SS1]|uniref:Uncharacterized protein n=1 Tax=Botryobasidium botryosum (strain FD-172 SS1) TaxID=930990 RepID=A0A067M0A6_BOTB1|nr:hypothetical protein BOTBODRAFT_37478 [Botryobasidium botryosum FD-172 SS1]
MPLSPAPPPRCVLGLYLLTALPPAGYPAISFIFMAMANHIRRAIPMNRPPLCKQFLGGRS